MGDAWEIIKICKDEELMISNSIEEQALVVGEQLQVWKRKQARQI